MHVFCKPHLDAFDGWQHAVNSTGQNGLGRAPAARNENTAHGRIHCNTTRIGGSDIKEWGASGISCFTIEHACFHVTQQAVLTVLVFSPAASRRASFTMSCPTILDIGYGLDGIFTGCMTVES